MESFFVYILFSQKLDKFYTGLTTLSPQERFENHLGKKYSNTNYTQKANDWVVFLSMECETLSQARKIELHIKKMKSKKYLKDLSLYPEMKIKLLVRFKVN